MFGKIVSGIIGGVIIAILGSVVVGGLFSALGGDNINSETEKVAFLILWGVGLVLALTASRAAKAWRRIFLISAMLSFAIPLSAFIFTGSHISEVANQGGEHTNAAVVGAVLGGGILTVVSGFIGFFLGAIFLVAGLLTGRDKEVIIIKE